MNNIGKKKQLGTKLQNKRLTDYLHALDVCVHTCVKALLVFKAALHHISNKIRFTHASMCSPCIAYQESTTGLVNARRQINHGSS